MPLPSGRNHISSETPGPALAVLAICSAGASTLVAGSAIAYQLKYRQLGGGSKLNLEWNVLLTFALAVCIAQSAVTADQVAYGLGYPIRMLTSNDETMFLKLEYANNLLYIGSLLLLKAVQSLLQLATTFPRPNYWAPAMIIAGMLAFLFTAAFGCQSLFWKLRGNRCIDQTAFWIAFSIFDIVSDIYSVSVVIWVSSSLKMRKTSKIKLLIILASRFLPAACAIARIPFIHTAYTSSNYTIALYKLGIPTQLQLHLSIVALSLGKVFHFLNFLDVGYLSSAIEPTHGKGTVNRSRADKYGYDSKPNSHLSHTKKLSISDHESSRNLVPADYGQTTIEVEGGIPMGKMKCAPVRQQGPHSRNQSDEAVPKGNEIRVTTHYEIRSENAAKNGFIEDDIEGFDRFVGRKSERLVDLECFRVGKIHDRDVRYEKSCILMSEKNPWIPVS